MVVTNHNHTQQLSNQFNYYIIMTRNNRRQQTKNRNGARRSGSCAYCHKDGHYARDKQRQITCPVLFAAEERKKRPAPSKILTVQPRKALSTAKLTEALDNGTLVAKCTYKGRTNRSRPPAIVTQFSGLDFSSDDDSPSPTDHPNVEWRCKLTYGSGSTASMKAELLELQAELAQANANPTKSWADAGDIQDLEEKIEELKAQLA